jgi:D-glycero-beta-D-manno-heptose 1-phosphate adenylyltransferase
MTQETFLKTIAEARKAGKKIVFTNGVFDILHVGHTRYLAQARDLGDCLFVGVNSDESVKRLNKGPERPINTESDRVEVLEALGCVSGACVFTEDTPIEIIKLVKPDIHTKGGDYEVEALPETPIVRQFGGDVVLLPFVAGKSTTQTVHKMREK